MTRQVNPNCLLVLYFLQHLVVFFNRAQQQFPLRMQQKLCRLGILHNKIVDTLLQTSKVMNGGSINKKSNFPSNSLGSSSGLLKSKNTKFFSVLNFWSNSRSTDQSFKFCDRLKKTDGVDTNAIVICLPSDSLKAVNTSTICLTRNSIVVYENQYWFRLLFSGLLARKIFFFYIMFKKLSVMLHIK